MRRILGRANSINVMKVIWACEELGLPYAREDLGGPFGGLDTPAYRAMNPNALIPVLVEPDGWLMWESNAILRYLGTAYGKGGPLWPDDPRARATSDQWMDWQQTVANASLGPAFVQMYRTPAEKRDQAVIDKSIARSAEAFRVIEAHLASQPYVAGDTFTLGDIPVGCHVYRYLHLPIDRPDMPALAAYHERLLRRLAYATHVALPIT
ncbi:glutathione S-transferase family protein [Elioraea sp.]|uniref:glutathione S-transferase family protein n=1 Tax=Elioraea sp. TaxID=2185103 RepID=UPI0025B9F1AD|nr:glutathione S-transferase family protein [Elioraea sp.]